MIMNLIATGFILGIFFMVFVTPASLYKGVFKMAYGDDVTKGELIRGYIPIYNVIKAESVYCGSKINLIAVTTFIIILLLRLLVVTLFPTVYFLNLITVILFLLSMIVIYAANAYLVFKILYESRVISMGKIIIYSIIYPMGQYYIGNHMATVIKNLTIDEETF